MKIEFCRHCVNWKYEYVELKSSTKEKSFIVCKNCFTQKVENSLIKGHKYNIIKDTRKLKDE